MGAVYDEEEELDFTFLNQNPRRRPSGAGQAGRGQADRGKSRRTQTSRDKNRRGQQTPQGRQGQGQKRRTPQTMQEKQGQRLARRKRQMRRRRRLLALLSGVLLLGFLFAIRSLQRQEAQTGGQAVTSAPMLGSGEASVRGVEQGIPRGQYSQHPEWTEDFLTISEYSRPGDPIGEVKNIFVHYTANLNTSAAQNRSYFENLKDNHDVRGASAHFIIGIEGEILQIVPLDEMAYAVKTRNEDSISIECCYKYENGQFTQETYDSLIELLAWLLQTYGLEPDDILRHYDCGGKKCPLYYVEHEDAWKILKQDVADRISLAR